MNIFCLDPCPVQSAAWLDDIRANKMVLESAQMLSTAIRMIDPQKDHPVYRIAYLNHPCTKWVRQSRNNFIWLCQHMAGLLSRRNTPHKSSVVLDYALTWVQNAGFEKEDQTPFANCARNLERGVDFSHVSDVHKAYKLYMVERWKEKTIKLTWVTGQEPEWRG